MINANEIRKTVVNIAVKSKEGHIASSFSIIEMLIAIYESMATVGDFEPQSIVLSKGHASYAYYAFLNEIGLMSQEELNQVGEIESKYYGHLPYIHNDVKFQFGSGSLGHGIPYSVGLRYAREIKENDAPVYCIIGDGEANEGTFWETLLLIQKLKLKNLSFLVDLNGSSERAIPIKNTLLNLKNVFDAVDFYHCDGHDVNAMQSILLNGHAQTKVMVCETLKGNPIPFMINNPIWHHRTPNHEDIEKIMEYLK